MKFNIRARAGIDYLVKAGIIRKTPADIARFLFAHEASDGSRCDELNRQRIGEYRENPPQPARASKAAIPRPSSFLRSGDAGHD